MKRLAFVTKLYLKKDYAQISMQYNKNQNETQSSEAVVWKCSVEKVFRPATLLKKKLRCFPVNFAKILRTPFLQSLRVTTSVN